MINLLVGVVTFAGALLILPQDDGGDASVHIDLPGFLLLAGSTFGVLFGSSRAPTPAAGLHPRLTPGRRSSSSCSYYGSAARQHLFLQRSSSATVASWPGSVVSIFFAAAHSASCSWSGFVRPDGAWLTTLRRVTSPRRPSPSASWSLRSSRGTPWRSSVAASCSLPGVLAGVAIMIAILVALPDTSQLSTPFLTLPLFIIGVGAGPAFAAVFDVALGDIALDEAGSASGSVTAVRSNWPAPPARPASRPSTCTPSPAAPAPGRAVISLLIVEVGLAGLLGVRGMPRAASAMG
ncbi:MAG: hypothetical protein U0075_21270 [Thermomicrobiales bacterium]